MKSEIEEFMPYLDGLDMTKEQKEECIHDVCRFFEAFADQAFGVHPVQNIRGYKADKDLQNPLQAIDSKVSPICKNFADTARDAANDNSIEREKYGT